MSGNKAFIAAENKGRRAFLEGKPRTANPYRDVRADYHESVTFSRAFVRAWWRGWDAEEAVA